MVQDLRTGFWRNTPLSEMTGAEWEALCDGCGRCCLIKLEDADTGEVAYTDVACQLLEIGACRCADYANRAGRVPGCLVLTPETLPAAAAWMPPTCAYRRLHEGQDLPHWHPLITGRRESVREAGLSVAGRVLPEAQCAEEDLPDRIVDWPGEDPFEEGRGAPVFEHPKKTP